MRIGFRILWLAQSVKPLTEFPETREGLGLAPEHFPLALCERQVFNLGPEALGHREWASGWITEVKPGCMPQIPECIVFRAGDWQFSFRSRIPGGSGQGGQQQEGTREGSGSCPCTASLTLLWRRRRGWGVHVAVACCRRGWPLVATCPLNSHSYSTEHSGEQVLVGCQLSL